MQQASSISGQFKKSCCGLLAIPHQERMTSKERTTWAIVQIVISAVVFSVGITTYYRKDKAQLQEIASLHKELEDRFEFVLDLQASDTYGLARLDSQGRVIEWNKALEKWTGYTQQEMLGQTLHSVMEPEVADRHQKAFEKAMHSEFDPEKLTVVRCKITNRDQTKPPQPVLVSVRAFPEGRNGPYATAMVSLEKNVEEIVVP
jgi:PAS domain S-box-containing protein